MLVILVIYRFCECDTRPSARYLMKKKRKGLERVCKLLLAKLSPPKQSVN